MRTDYLCGCLWAAGRRESQVKRLCGTEKQRQKKNHFWIRKNAWLCSQHSTLKHLSSSFNTAQLGFVSRQCSFTRQSMPTLEPAPASILSSTPFTHPAPALALGPFCKAGSGAYMWQNFCSLPVSGQSSAELVKSKQFKEGSEKRWHWHEVTEPHNSGQGSRGGVLPLPSFL